MQKRDAYKEISNKLAQAKALIKDCEKIADETGESFNWSLGYGMGGVYKPTNKIKVQALEKLTDEEKEVPGLDNLSREVIGGWSSSSENC